MAGIGFFITLAGGLLYWFQPFGWIGVGIGLLLTLLGASTQPSIAIAGIIAAVVAAGLNYYGLHVMTFGILG